MQSAYTIQEYVCEVMWQLKSLVPNGQPVHFSIHTYNPRHAYVLKALQEKGLCVVTDNCACSFVDEKTARLEFDVIMSENYQDLKGSS